MTLADWVSETRERYQRFGAAKATRFSVNELLIGAGRRLGQSVNFGQTAWEADWDVLIILDACRWDLMQEVAPQYDWLPNEVPSVYSAASMSEEWLERHTVPKHRENMARTALISGNAFPYLSDTVDPSEWAHVDNLVTHQWNEEHGIVLPRSVTDASVDFWRNRRASADADRLIIWYIQPHAPFIGVDWSEGFNFDHLGNPDEGGESVWYRLRNGDLQLPELWSAYRDNLRYVLDDVELLLRNLEADRVVITSDHANCVGETGIYGHPKYVPHPTLKRVPWIEVEATDMDKYRPEYEPAAQKEQEMSDDEVDERLEALGYV